MRHSSRGAGPVLALAILLAVGTALADDEEPAPRGSPTTDVVAAPVPTAGPTTPAPSPATEQAPALDAGDGDLLQPAAGGDGDSWRDTSGREYRLGMVNAPETGDCFGAEATDRRQAMTAAGFRAEVYAQDDYGRGVAVVTLPDGTNLNVWLARHGYADDRYLEQFRSENPALAVELDTAFAAARAERAGLWAACSGTAPHGIVAAPPPPPPPAAAPAPGDCHPDYLTCIPVKGDGSGQGEANDLDCGSIGVRVQLRQVGVDPYRLDREGDGFGCEGP